jgi:hypothetical protein
MEIGILILVSLSTFRQTHDRIDDLVNIWDHRIHQRWTVRRRDRLSGDPQHRTF